MEARSKCCLYFDKTKDETGGPAAKCKYYGKKLCANTKRNGTSNLRNHILTGNKMPYSKDTRQSLLTLLHASNDYQSQLGVIGTWNFDQEAIRKALAHMLIVDELPFKFIEGDGIKTFMASCCTRFKISS